MPANNAIKDINPRIDKIITKLGSSNDSDIATAVLAGFKLFFIPLATLSDKNATKEQKEYAASRDFLTEVIALASYVGITKMFKWHGTTPICNSYYKKKVKMIREGKIPGVDPSKFSEKDFQALENIDKKSFKSVMLDMYQRPKNKPKATDAERKYVADLTKIVKKFQDVYPKFEEPKAGFKKFMYSFSNFTDKRVPIQLPEKLYNNARLSISQVCIWTLAVLVIPPLCNVMLKPLLTQIKKAQEKKHIAESAQAVTPAVAELSANKYGAKMNKEQVGNVTSFKGNYRNVNIGNMRVGM